MKRPDTRYAARERGWTRSLGARLPEGLRAATPLLPALAILALGLWGFGALSEDVLTGDPLVAFDARLADWLHEHRVGAVTVVMRAVTTLGSAPVLISFAAAVLVWLLSRRRWGEAGLVLLATVGAELLTTGLKVGFGRERPFFPDPLATETSFSYPSGHATVSLALYGALAVLLVRAHPTRRAPIMVGAGALVLLIGFSRLYLGVHFLSDVLAGFSAGMVWLTLCVIAVFGPRLTRRVVSRASTSAVPPGSDGR
jgi:membrane-associated phospholipid phosphatase